VREAVGHLEGVGAWEFDVEEDGVGREAFDGFEEVRGGGERADDFDAAANGELGFESFDEDGVVIDAEDADGVRFGGGLCFGGWERFAAGCGGWDGGGAGFGGFQ
jgi:hypothetical protein